MFTTLRTITVTAMLATALPAAADDTTYSSNDIVKFFQKQKVMLVTRGICVGTEEECNTAQINDHTQAFDLMINFNKDSAELTQEARSNLIEFSVALRHPKMASLQFAVDGFTDASGDTAHNLQLSQKRADSVVLFLSSLGVNPEMLKSRGWGETAFRADDEMDPANRRVETRLIKAN